MLKKINDQNKMISQLQVANKDLIKHKSKKIKTLKTKLQLCRKSIMTQTTFNNKLLTKDKISMKREVEIGKNKVEFECLMKIIEKLNIELNSKSSEMRLELHNLKKVILYTAIHHHHSVGKFIIPFDLINY